jgi:hypothetical protein
MSVKKGVLHVRLVNWPGAQGGDAEDGLRLDNRTEGLVVVDAGLLHLPVTTVARGESPCA